MNPEEIKQFTDLADKMKSEMNESWRNESDHATWKKLRPVAEYVVYTLNG